jgi:aromatic ring-cleaving dioxygenase
MTIQPIDTIQTYHAHIYFADAGQRRVAEMLREEIARRFSVRLGRWHDRLVGPHTRPMYQVSFSPEEFPRLVPWLMINRRGLAMLIHPNTGRPRSDHLEHPIWLGEILDIDAAPLSEEDEAEPEIDLNTHPTVQP